MPRVYVCPTGWLRIWQGERIPYINCAALRPHAIQPRPSLFPSHHHPPLSHRPLPSKQTNVLVNLQRKSSSSFCLYLTTITHHHPHFNHPNHSTNIFSPQAPPPRVPVSNTQARAVSTKLSKSYAKSLTSFLRTLVFFAISEMTLKTNVCPESVSQLIARHS